MDCELFYLYYLYYLYVIAYENIICTNVVAK